VMWCGTPTATTRASRAIGECDDYTQLDVNL